MSAVYQSSNTHNRNINTKKKTPPPRKRRRATDRQSPLAVVALGRRAPPLRLLLLLLLQQDAFCEPARGRGGHRNAEDRTSTSAKPARLSWNVLFKFRHGNQFSNFKNDGFCFVIGGRRAPGRDWYAPHASLPVQFLYRAFSTACRAAQSPMPTTGKTTREIMETSS